MRARTVLPCLPNKEKGPLPTATMPGTMSCCVDTASRPVQALPHVLWTLSYCTRSDCEEPMEVGRWARVPEFLLGLVLEVGHLHSKLLLSDFEFYLKSAGIG
jgi:hypothetical protein